MGYETRTTIELGRLWTQAHEQTRLFRASAIQELNHLSYALDSGA